MKDRIVAIEFCDTLKFLGGVNDRKMRFVTAGLTTAFHEYRPTEKFFNNIWRRRL
ncbi:MAG: hypothetical protein ACREA2_19310 [Blastocatellia bacterium]